MFQLYHPLRVRANLLILICFRKVYSILGTNSLRCRSKIGGVTLISAWKYNGSGRRCQLLVVQLRKNEVSYQNSKKNDPWQIVFTSSVQSFKAIEPKMSPLCGGKIKLLWRAVSRIFLNKSSSAIQIRPHYCALKLRYVSKFVPWSIPDDDFLIWEQNGR